MKVRWTESARLDLRGILRYIGSDNMRAAQRMNDLFHAATDRLLEHPKLGKSGEIPGTRELLPHRSYRMVYEIRDDVIWVVALVHTARQWPPLA